MEVDKLLILNESLKQENIEVQTENKQLTDKVTQMKQVMLEYDREAIELESEDNVSINDLIN